MSRLPHRCTPRRALLAALFLSPGASATEWTIDPTITIGLERHDNTTFSQTKSGDVSATTLYPEINFIARQQNWDARLQAQTRHSRYSEERFDNDAATARISGRYLTERNQWQLDASAINDSLITGDQVDPDTSLSRGQRDRTTRTASPTWSYLLGPDTQIKLNLQGTTVSYDNGEGVGLYDYEQRGGSAQYSWVLSERTKVYATAGESTFKVPTLNQYESTTRSVQLGFSRQWTETLNSDISAGRRRTITQGYQQVCPADTIDLRIYGGNECLDLQLGLIPTVEALYAETTHGTTLNASLTQRFELTTLVLSLSRSLDPSGSGTQVETDTALIRLERPIASPNLLASLTLERRELRAVGGNPTLTDRDYERIEPRLRWQLTQEWTLDTVYRHSRQQYRAQEGEITANSAFISMAYRWPRMTISR